VRPWLHAWRRKQQLWWGYADMKVGWFWELCRLVKGACTQCARLFLTSADTVEWEWCDWIWELWQQHVQESSGSVVAGWSAIWAGCNKVSCSSQAWSEQWKWRWWKLFWNRGMDGYSEADEYGNCRTWRQMRSGPKKWDVHRIWSRDFEQSEWC